jgi:HPt (histidine-containing phosphotransfer) domain-containing protein
MNSHSEDVFLPIIDWEQAAKLAGSRIDLAKDFLKLFVETLENEIVALEKLKDDRDELLKRLHRIRGAAAYCGIPRFKHALLSTENIYKLDHTAEARATHLQLLLDNARELIEYHAQL